MLKHRLFFSPWLFLLAIFVYPDVLAEAQASGSAEILACDRIAAHPLDPARVAPGQPTGNIDLPLAIQICRADLNDNPDNARIRYQYARVLFYAGQFDEALAEMRRAANYGHAQAQFVYGIFVVKQRPGAPRDKCIAERNWQAASAGGRHAAAVHYATQKLRATFDTCSDVAALEELMQWLDAAHDAAPAGYAGYYRRLFIEDLQFRLKNSVDTWSNSDLTDAAKSSINFR